VTAAVTPLAHIMGIPVEETVLTFGPVGAVGVGAAACMARARLARISSLRHDRRRRAHGPCEDPASGRAGDREHDAGAAPR
jgi:hypothetical protein